MFIDAIIDGALMVIKVTGSILKQVLEHSCAACPGGYSGSFLCVSGV